MADKPARTVKVKLLTGRVVQSGQSFHAQKPGQTVEMPADEAQRYCDAGFAEPVEPGQKA